MKKTAMLTTLMALGAFAAPALAQVETESSVGTSAATSVYTSVGTTDDSDLMDDTDVMDADSSAGTTGSAGSNSSLPGLPNTGGGWGGR
jgi:hypothetical protein